MTIWVAKCYIEADSLKFTHNCTPNTIETNMWPNFGKSTILAHLTQNIQFSKAATKNFMQWWVEYTLDT